MPVARQADNSIRDVRFKQISGNVYGLTEDGRVYIYRYDSKDQKCYWVPLNMEEGERD